MSTRRGLLGFVGGSVAATAALSVAAKAAGVHPDAELLRLGGLFDQADMREQRAWAEIEGDDTVDDDHPKWVAAGALQGATSEIVRRIEDLRAATLEGVLVKVRAIAWCRSGEPVTAESLDPCGPATDMRMLAGVMRDLAAMGGALAARP